MKMKFEVEVVEKLPACKMGSRYVCVATVIGEDGKVYNLCADRDDGESVLAVLADTDDDDIFVTEEEELELLHFCIDHDHSASCYPGACHRLCSHPAAACVQEYNNRNNAKRNSWV